MSVNTPSLRTLILLINTAGLVGYLAWLVAGHQRIFYTQDGIVFLLPCLPFFFVYMYLLRGPPGNAGDDHEEQD